MIEKNELRNAAKVETGNISRRGLMQGAGAIAGAAVISTFGLPEKALAKGAPKEAGKAASQIVSSSNFKNIVETDSGKISGYESGGIIGFKGVPYGGSTDGKNRFMPPTRPAPWTGVKETTYWGWSSPQVFTDTVKGRRAGWTHDDESFMFEWEDGKPSEDCLRLNVWTPATDNKKRPVIFWIHGGGYYSGSSYELKAYEGENLARRGDVVVVSMNHRLGALGYLNLAEYGEQYAHSANAGQQDIVAALQWVKTNISNFGGDPNAVMIFGQSGGCRKTSTLLGMPMAKGLFRSAGMHSSDPYSQGSNESTAAVSAALIKQLGLTKDTIGKIHELPVEAVIQAGRDASPGNAWIAWVDGQVLPRKTFDPTAPEINADVPMMFGSVLNEMANTVQIGDRTLEDMPESELRRRMTVTYKDRADAVIGALQQAHPKAKPFDLYSLAAGAAMRRSLLKAAAAKTAEGKAPAYVWQFAWQSPMFDGRARAYHTAELPFVFYNTDVCQRLTGGGPVPMALGGKVADAWISFARTGNPNHAGLPDWPAYNAKVPTMVLDNVCQVQFDHDGAIRKAMGDV
jgi:para-nitrobenzyl esterase